MARDLSNAISWRYAHTSAKGKQMWSRIWRDEQSGAMEFVAIVSRERDGGEMPSRACSWVQTQGSTKYSSLIITRVLQKEGLSLIKTQGCRAGASKNPEEEEARRRDERMTKTLRVVGLSIVMLGAGLGRCAATTKAVDEARQGSGRLVPQLVTRGGLGRYVGRRAGHARSARHRRS